MSDDDSRATAGSLWLPLQERRSAWWVAAVVLSFHGVTMSRDLTVYERYHENLVAALERALQGDFGVPPEQVGTFKLYMDRGCGSCNNTGYKGRVGLYEVMEIGEQLRELILVGASGLKLRRKAVEEGMITLRRSGLHKVMEGVTTIEEVARETVK